MSIIMTSTNGLTDFIAQIVVGGGIAFIKTRLWTWNIRISDDFIYKTYYEFKEWMIRHNIDDIVDRDQFIEIMISVLHAVEGGVDEELARDPEFIEKTLKTHSWLWVVYSIFKDFVTSNNIKKIADSPVTRSLDQYLNGVMIEKENLLEYKIKRDVDFALEDAQEMLDLSTEIYGPIFDETIDYDSPLGGEMEISSNWENY